MEDTDAFQLLQFSPFLQRPLTAQKSAAFPQVSSFASLISILFGLLLVTAAAFAQVETGQIAGTVTDESGAVVPGATVTVKNLASNAQRTTATSPTGSYVVVGLAARHLPGFRFVGLRSSRSCRMSK